VLCNSWWPRDGLCSSVESQYPSKTTGIQITDTKHLYQMSWDSTGFYIKFLVFWVPKKELRAPPKYQNAFQGELR